MENTSEIAECINKLIGTIKSLEGHIDALETENHLLKTEIASSSVSNASLPSKDENNQLRNAFAVSIAPYVLTKTEIFSFGPPSDSLTEAHIKRASKAIFDIADQILKHC